MTFAGKECEKARQLSKTDCGGGCCCCIQCNECHMPCARFSSAHFTRRTDFQWSAALFDTRREEEERERERERELSPIPATGGNRPIPGIRLSSRGLVRSLAMPRMHSHARGAHYWLPRALARSRFTPSCATHGVALHRRSLESSRIHRESLNSVIILLHRAPNITRLRLSCRKIRSRIVCRDGCLKLLFPPPYHIDS